MSDYNVELSRLMEEMKDQAFRQDFINKKTSAKLRFLLDERNFTFEDLIKIIEENETSGAITTAARLWWFA
ncbi:MAG: hypothetical protein MUO76_00520 [Anaerolineaceae bacterium]|nr:hypothetical protein [Anaerolineaceae bacterium]